MLGAIAFAFSSAQLFDDDQRSLLQTAADVTAQSLDRARLYERERDVARTLQLALLPAALPSLDDIRIEARYVAGGADVTVGGDWYDVLRFDDDRIGLLIGDAAGRGIEAATFMGKVRNAAAALAMEHASPARVLQRVNDYLHYDVVAPLDAHVLLHRRRSRPANAALCVGGSPAAAVARGRRRHDVSGSGPRRAARCRCRRGVRRRRARAHRRVDVDPVHRRARRAAAASRSTTASLD